MTQELIDNTGASVTVTLDVTGPIHAYTVNLGDGPPIGRAQFVDNPGVGEERIFFHTEIDQEFGGRGLAGLLVREALDDSIRKNLTVVPVCPLFARHLKKHGDEFVANGGMFRQPTPSDFALVRRATQS
ncbi:GNAT family N-acetyltransferase [Streptomyces boninensis]|uniref:GNAT family N-acetyltransferase n=1 Tax=Streptomyces boninensis TaxID=2039455 RepID=UPI003B21E7F0